MISIEKIFSRPLDFEYKRFVLRSYFDRVRDHFDHVQCLPHYELLAQTYQQIRYMSKSQSMIDASLSDPILDLFEGTQDNNTRNRHIVETVRRLLGFCEPRIGQLLKRGKTILSRVSDTILVEPVGIVPLYCDEGYVIIDNLTDSYNTFSYTVGLYDHDASAPRIRFSYVSTHKKSCRNTVNNIKAKLMRLNKHTPNPAVFYSRITNSIPFVETALPASEVKLCYFLQDNGLIGKDGKTVKEIPASRDS